MINEFTERLRKYLFLGFILIIVISGLASLGINYLSYEQQDRATRVFIQDLILQKKSLIEEEIYLKNFHQEKDSRLNTIENLNLELVKKGVRLEYELNKDFNCENHQGIRISDSCLNYKMSRLGDDKEKLLLQYSFFPIIIFLSLLFWSFYKFFIQNKIINPLIIETENNLKYKTFNQIAQQVGHDIRSPLMVLKTLLKQSDSINNQEVEMANYSLLRIEQILDDLTQKDKQKKNINLYIVVEKIVAEKNIQRRKNIKLLLRRKLEIHDCHFYTEEIEFARVISNLLNNAIEASHEGQIIEINFEQEQDQMKILISDQGRGIEKDKLDLIGKKGVSYKNQGQGLGLFHAKEYMLKNEGRITIESTGMNQGTTVTIFFPHKIAMKYPWHQIEEAVLIDDDEGIRQLWELYSKKSSHLKKLSTFKSFQDFMKVNESLNRKSVIFIDSFLENSQRGEDLAKSIHELGFETIIVFTAEPELVQLNPYITLVHKKFYPF